MYKQYIKQAVQMLRENTLVSVISISGTALAIAMVLVMVLVFQIKSTGYAPESNRSRFMYVWGTEVGSKSPGESDRNRGGMSSEVVKECFYTLRKPEAVSGYCSDSHSLSLPNRRLFKEYEICYTDAGHWKYSTILSWKEAPLARLISIRYTEDGAVGTGGDRFVRNGTGRRAAGRDGFYHFHRLRGGA